MAVGPVCKRVASNHISDARHFPTALHTELVVGIGFRFGIGWALVSPKMSVLGSEGLWLYSHTR
jgi:hypothetical protein